MHHTTKHPILHYKTAAIKKTTTTTTAIQEVTRNLHRNQLVQ